MPKILILLLSVLFIIYLLISDIRRKPPVSLALWIPLLWLMILASRPVSLWLNLGMPVDAVGDISEGNPLDRNILIIFIIIGSIILSRRKIDWSAIGRNNILIFVYILYLGLSTLWSDYTFISFKRWIREIGNLIMVLIIIAEPEPIEAIKTIIKRCSYVLIPLSIVFIKYYPDLGRSMTGKGSQGYIGVATNKNALGFLCLVCGLFLFWNLVKLWRNRKLNKNTKEVFIHVLLLFMISWLLCVINSATSLACTIIGVFLIILLPKLRNRAKFIGICIPFAVLIFLVINFSFDVSDAMLSGLGREETLTGRTEVWKKVLEIGTNPWIGTGYESFWLHPKVQEEFEGYLSTTNQAHNGYLEIYLNVGYIGLILLMGAIYNAFRNITKKFTDPSTIDYQSIRGTFLILILLVNITEAAFKGMGLSWFMFLLIAVDGSRRIENQVPLK